MNREHIEALRIPLIVFAITLVLAGGLIYVSANTVDGARRALTQRENQLRDARLRIQNAAEEKEMISRYLRNYEQLARAGFVGDEQRINWLDSLRLANAEAGTFGAEYDISAQRPYTYATEFNTGQLSLLESLMRLKFRLLHEEDLPRFFDALARGNAGFFTVDQCMLRRVRISESDRSAVIQPRLAAECDVRWLTVKPTVIVEKKG